jgi:hypothetical protein
MALNRSLAAGLALALALGTVASADHSWGGYHWARSGNPFTVVLGDNVDSRWDSWLAEASGDWSASTVLDTTISGGQAKGNCKPPDGRVEVCNSNYGFNGWLGVAQIWVSGDHIVKGAVKLNDSYHDVAPYNEPGWRDLVVCQEVGHIFGLGHQDENFDNGNLGTCMDYTSDPDGPPPNLQPDQTTTICSLRSTATLTAAAEVTTARGRPGSARARSRRLQPSTWIWPESDNGAG